MVSFRDKILQLVKKIPTKKVVTYSYLAKKSGKPKAYRAVGTVLRKNPFIGKIPCHRVIKSNGQPGEYVRGKKLKIQLLKEEGVIFLNNNKISSRSIISK